MTKKAMAIVGLAGVIALSGGAITLFATRDRNSGENKPAPTESITEAATDYFEPVDDPMEATDDAEPSTEPETELVTEEPTKEDNYDSNGYTDLLVSADTYRIRRVYNHTAECEVTAREVFGKLYSYCSLSFSDDATFELCINPTSGETRTGSYAVYDDVISVVYDDDGRGAEFRIITDNPGEIGYILVNYGDYDVYFG